MPPGLAVKRLWHKVTARAVCCLVWLLGHSLGCGGLLRGARQKRILELGLKGTDRVGLGEGAAKVGDQLQTRLGGIALGRAGALTEPGSQMRLTQADLPPKPIGRAQRKQPGPALPGTVNAARAVQNRLEQDAEQSAIDTAVRQHPAQMNRERPSTATALAPIGAQHPLPPLHPPGASAMRVIAPKQPVADQAIATPAPRTRHQLDLRQRLLLVRRIPKKRWQSLRHRYANSDKTTNGKWRKSRKWCQSKSRHRGASP